MRPNRNDVLMLMASAAALRGTCSRLQVGVVFSREGRVLVTGYNGAPSGIPHCIHTKRIDEEPCEIAEHAERNAIAFAARHGVRLDGATMHVTHQPCLNCARTVLTAGISAVYYDMPFRDQRGIELLQKAGLKVMCWESKFYVSDRAAEIEQSYPAL